MGSFKPDEIDPDNLEGIRYAIVGYGLLMPYFDRPDDNYGTLMGQFLSTLQKRGIKTVLDFVTPKNEQWWKFNRYRKSLRFVDVLSIGKDQAEAITGHQSGDKAARSFVEDFCVGIGVVHCGEEGTNYLYSEKIGIITAPIFSQCSILLHP